MLEEEILKILLALWKEWGLDHILRKAWEQGTILAGISAGSICWFEEGLTDSFGTSLEPIQCLGILKGSCCPHYDGEIERKPAYKKMIDSGKIISGVAMDDGVAIHYLDQKMNKIVSSRPEAKAYEVKRIDNEVIQNELEVNYLGTK